MRRIKEVLQQPGESLKASAAYGLNNAMLIVSEGFRVLRMCIKQVLTSELRRRIVGIELTFYRMKGSEKVAENLLQGEKRCSVTASGIKVVDSWLILTSPPFFPILFPGSLSKQKRLQNEGGRTDCTRCSTDIFAFFFLTVVL